VVFSKSIEAERKAYESKETFSSLVWFVISIVCMELYKIDITICFCLVVF
jgi:hypothetical protein